MDDRIGYVHSIYTGGMVDGPGIRTVVFLSGCKLRCKYCHNPDTWNRKSGNKMTVRECISEILKYKSYYRFSGGGVTISGGEPVHQHEFLSALLDACRENKIHATVDTTGYTSADIAEKILPKMDLLLLDIKAFDPETYKNVTGVDIDYTIEFLRLSRKLKIPAWIRYVLVPGLTDSKEEMQNLAIFLKDFENIEKVYVLPFHKEGEYKWDDIETPYELSDTPIPTQQQVDEAQKIFNNL